MLDEFRSTYITWDKATSRIYSPVTANASDENGRKLVVQIVNSGQVEDLTGATLHLYWETRDKAHDGLDAFDASDISKGEFELSYTTGMLSNQGVLNANLVLIDTVGRVVSERFKITVTEGIDDDAIQSENSFSSLTQALIDISNLEQNYAPRLSTIEQNQVSLEQELAHKASQAEMYSNITAPKALSLSQSPNKKPFISFVDDDGYKKAYSLLAPMLEQRGMVGNLAITVSRVGETNRVTTDDLLDLQSRGFEIASHNYTDVYFEAASLTPEEIENEMRMTKETLNSWGIQVENHVYTGGQMAGDVGRSIVKKYFKAGYGAGESTHTAQNNVILDEMAITRISIDVPSLSHLKAQVDRCVEENNWLIFMCHCNNWNSERIQIVSDLLEYVSYKDVTVGTLSEGYDIFGNSFAIGHKNYIKLLSNGEIYSNAIGSVFRHPDNGYDIDEDTPLYNFEANKITYSHIRTSNDIEMPSPTNEGVLTTYHFGRLGAGSSYQTWVQYNREATYKRRWNGTSTVGEWGDWVSNGNQTFTKDVELGPIPANSTIEVTLEHIGLKREDIVQANPRFLLANGIIWTTYVFVDEVRIRFMNITDVEKNVGGQPWLISINKNNL